MLTGKHFFVIDDDSFTLTLVERFLTDAGARVTSSDDSELAFRQIIRDPPDCVITDLMMPKLDGYGLCAELRQHPSLRQLKIIVLSSKSYDFDQRRARQVGADGYIVKPVSKNSFLEQIQSIVGSRITLRYWGVRGTLPVPGPKSLRYGGNTSCVTTGFSDGRIFIFDAGSGIRNLGHHLLRKGGRISGKIFISHPHWDHINALPFFTPLYVQGNEFEVLGPMHSDKHMRELIGDQMDGIYFPVTMREFGASVTFRDLREETLQFGDVEVATMLLTHPGACLGYRIRHGGKTIAYITDNELYLPDSPRHDPHFVTRLVAFIEGADVLITDTTYTDEGYKSKVGWGHSCIGQAVKLAHAAQVGALHLFHHDPDDTDDHIDAKLEAARRALEALGSAVPVIAPAEGDELQL
jgi:phosphoribosyl 1,2-cyclic phosphodiesterase